MSLGRKWIETLELGSFTVYHDRIELLFMHADGERNLLIYNVDVPRRVASADSFQIGTKYRITLEQVE